MKIQASLSFMGGTLLVNRAGYLINGAGEFSFSDTDLAYEGENCETRTIKLERSEIEAIRDFLVYELSLIEDDNA